MPAFSTNLNLSALPEYDQQKDPALYAELNRLRNAFRILQGAIDGLGGGGGIVVTHPAGPLALGQPVLGDGAGGIYSVSSVPTAGNGLTSHGVGVDPTWAAAGGGGGTGGTYTPIGTIGANVSAVTPDLCQYTRVGDIVTVFGRVDADWIAGLTLTSLRLSLPIPSNIGSTSDLHGTAYGKDAVSSFVTNPGLIFGTAATDDATLFFNSGPPGGIAYNIWFSFAYQVLP